MTQSNDEIRVHQIDTCLLCASSGNTTYESLSDRLFDVPGNWNLAKCPRCKLIWLNPRPVPEDVHRLYKRYYTHEPAINFNVASIRHRIHNAVLVSAFGYEKLAVPRHVRRLGRLLRLLPQIHQLAWYSIMCLEGPAKGKLLDIGSGNGWFLSTMRNLGWEVQGLEPDRYSAQIAQEALGIPTFIGTLKEANFSSELFHAITMRHVFEHVSDPLDILVQCRNLLKVGGRLVIVTPNIESLGHKYFKDSWLHLDPPRHFYLFSPMTLRVCVERAGLEIESLGTTSRAARGTWARSRTIKSTGKLPETSLSWNRLLEGIVFQLLEDGLNRVRKTVGEELVVVASRRAI